MTGHPVFIIPDQNPRWIFKGNGFVMRLVQLSVMLTFLLLAGVIMIQCFGANTIFYTEPMKLSPKADDIDSGENTDTLDRLWLYIRYREYQDQAQCKEIEAYQFDPTSGPNAGTYEYIRKKLLSGGKYSIITMKGNYEEDYKGHTITLYETEGLVEKRDRDGDVSTEEVEEDDLEVFESTITYDHTQLAMNPFCRYDDDGTVYNGDFVMVDTLVEGSLSEGGKPHGYWKSFDRRYENLGLDNPDRDDQYWVSNEVISELELGGATVGQNYSWYTYQTTEISHDYDFHARLTGYRAKSMNSCIENWENEDRTLFYNYYEKTDLAPEDDPPYEFNILVDEEDIDENDKIRLLVLLDECCTELFIESQNETQSICVNRYEYVEQDSESPEIWHYNEGIIELPDHRNQPGLVTCNSCFYFPQATKRFEPYDGVTFDDILKNYCGEESSAE